MFQQFVFIIFSSLIANTVACPKNCTCISNKYFPEVNCIDANFTEVILHVQKIENMSFVHIQHTRIGHLKKLPALNVYQLEMSNCGITSIEEFAFDQLRYLGELVLNYNLLTELPQLKKTMVFVTITAKGNMISKVSPNLFPIGSLIRNIDLSHNLLSDVEILNLAHINGTLRFLDLSYNLLRNVTFDGFPNLSFLRLIHNLFRTANSVVLKELPVLEKLDLSDNGISSLDVIQLKSAPVKQLGLEQNQLYSPLDFSKFTSLYLLNLASNSISELPIFPESLEILSLNNNQLNGSKLVFPALNLKEVYLSGNRFEALNSMAFINLANVSVITLLDNGLASYDLQLKKIANVRVDEKVALTINGINMTPHVPRVVYQRLLDLQNALTFEDSTDSA